MGALGVNHCPPVHLSTLVTSTLVTMMTLLPLLSLATAVLAAPQAFGRQGAYGREADDGSNNGIDYGSDYGSDDSINLRMADDMSMDDYGSDYGSDDGSDDGSNNGTDYGSDYGTDYSSEDSSNNGSNHGSDDDSNMHMADDGSDTSMDDYGSEFGSDAEDFDNLTMSRAAEERAINTCNCAPVSSSDRIVGGKEVNPKYKLPYQVLVSPCNKQGHCLMCGGTILNKRYVVTAAHCLYGGNDLMSLKDGATFRVLGGTPTAKAHHTQQDILSILSNSEGTSAVTLASILSLSPCTQLRGG